MKKQFETYEVTFEDMTHDARGVCKIDGYPVFVKDGLKGERSIIEITRRKKGYAEGRIIKRLENSPFRVEPICEHFSTCGGCNLMHMQYDTQLDYKTLKTQGTLKRIGHIETQIPRTHGMHQPYAYRNKATFHFSIQNGEIVGGYFQENSRSIVQIKRCHIVSKVFSDLLDECRKMAESGLLPVYDSKTGHGVFKGLMIRQSQSTKELLVTLITRTKNIPQVGKVVTALTIKYPEIVGIIQSYQDEDTSRLGRDFHLLFGQNILKETVGKITHQLSFQSFFQVNPQQAETMLKWIEEMALVSREDTILDAYAGVGYIGFSLANQVKKVILIESEKQAVLDGEKTAKTYHLNNTEFRLGDATQVIQMLEEPIDLVIADPPREGLNKKFIDSVIQKKINKMIYVSCNVSTLARDLKIFQDAGYQIIETRPLDMFPQTAHVESVTYLKRIQQS